MESQQKVSYYQEISMMMFGFGDSHKPNPDTVRLVESIVLKQLRMMIHEAGRSSDTQKTISGEDLIFLLRKNKHKMRRFVKYLHNKDYKKNLQAERLAMEKSEIINLADVHKNPLLNFIESLDETGELMDVNAYDSVKHERLIRADRMSQALDEEKYLEFYKARCMSFNSRDMSRAKNFEKLRTWIDPESEIIFLENSFDVLSYLAYETVAEMIHLALLVRQDCKRTSYDPLGMLAGSYYSAAAFSALHLPDGVQENLRVQTGQPPLTVTEVREASRRVFMPQVGDLKFGGKVPDSKRLLAC